MTTPTPVDDKPTIKHWAIAFVALFLLNIGIPAFVAAATSGVTP